MSIQAVSHVAVGVRDMEAALGFSRDVLGLRVTADKIEGQPARLFQMGVHHFAFWVDDIDEMMERVRAADVTVLMGGNDGPGADTTMYGEPAGGFVRSVFLQDPEGNHVQLDQRA